MLIPVKNSLDEKKNNTNNTTLIFIFIHKITPKNMQDLIFFLQKNDFHLKRITKKNSQQAFTSIFVNSNFILESKQNIRSQQLKELLSFLNQHTQINGVLFQNQILNFERIAILEKQSLLILWKQINNFML
jgi:parvulin-like peptidyl-prolyl isomerase